MKKALSQAKILAIDRNQGRVTLAMKNGLISTGTYLYDLNDLRVGMIVLIGKVSGTYVIMNKVAANPRNSSGMTLVKPVVAPFIFTYKTNESEYSWLGDDFRNFILPIIAEGIYNFDINWGDGSPVDHITSYDDPKKTHLYAEHGSYDVTITGIITGWYAQLISAVPFDYNKVITNIKQWGNFDFSIVNGFDYGYYGLFSGCAIPTIITAMDVPNLSNVTSLKSCFSGCTLLQEINNLENWNVSNVTDMSLMFLYAQAFNQNINDWNVSNVTNMSEMFEYAYAFNQPLNNWDVSKVTDMSYMFVYAQAFNQPLNNWDVSNVTSMEGMFDSVLVFNQNINNWNVSNVTSMEGMFNYAYVFNQPLNNWNVSNVTSMEGMFTEARTFNQSLNGWNTSKVTNMYGVFNGAISFNQPLNNWDVSNVTDMYQMFTFATSFNQPLNNWNTSKVTNMRYMFYNASVFNQDISMWDISNVTKMSAMFENSAFSTENYEKLLEGWSAQDVQPNVAFHAGTAKYHAAYAPYKQILLDKGWIITDGGQI